MVRGCTRAGMAAAGLALCAVGCASAPKNNAAQLSERATMYLAQVQDPRRFWLTPYETEDGPVLIGANRLHPNQAVSLPFLRGRAKHAPMVEVQGRGQPVFTALIDTSTAESWASFDAALELGAVPLGPSAYERRPRHVVDPEGGYLSVVSRLRFEELYVENVLLYARMSDGVLGPGARGVRQPAPRLVLGCDFLRSVRTVQFDYPRRRLGFSSTLPYEPPEATLLATVPMEEAHGLYAGAGGIDGVPATILLDAAGDFALAMSQPATNVVRHVEFGDLVFRRVPVADIDALGLGHPSYPRIGRHLLSRFKITIDNKRNVILFEKPPAKRQWL